MALWIVRAGRHGQFEQKFLDDSKVYLTWDNLDRNLSKLEDKSSLREVIEEIYPNASKGTVRNNLAQFWAFSHKIASADWVALPSKHKSAIHIAEVVGKYTHHPNAENPFYHSIDVKWIETDIPRSNFDQDILYSFGALMTVCQIKRNDAEARVRAMAGNQWKTTGVRASVLATSTDNDSEDSFETITDLEQVGRDQIAKFILAKFKGHGMARLIDAVLQAQGYTTHVSPPGPDKGIDILAAPGSLGFGTPRICVQVKASQLPLDRTVLDQLVGVMQNVNAEQGLLVSWGGFKTSIDREKANQFFRVRLWDQDDIIDQLLEHYERLGDDIRAELPLKRIWTLTEADDDE